VPDKPLAGLRKATGNNITAIIQANIAEPAILAKPA